VPIYKGIRSNQNGDTSIPAYDIEGKLWSVQTIRQNENGKFEKRFAAGGKIKDCMHVLDGQANLSDAKNVIIAEGYATAATIKQVYDENQASEYEKTAVVVAFSADNLVNVAKNIREKMPDANIVIAADNDRSKEFNKGLIKGQEAAEAVNGKLIDPFMGQGNTLQDTKITDFNDLANAVPNGLQVVAINFMTPLKHIYKEKPLESFRPLTAAEKQNYEQNIKPRLEAGMKAVAERKAKEAALKQQQDFLKAERMRQMR